MLTDDFLLLERRNIIGVRHGDGVQRIYRFPSGHGLSLVNAPILHSYVFAWEAAVLADVADDGSSHNLDYSTPLTDDIVVFRTDEEANDFIYQAIEYFVGIHWRTLAKVAKIRRGEQC